MARCEGKMEIMPHPPNAGQSEAETPACVTMCDYYGLETI
jgi:hypothetical protein